MQSVPVIPIQLISLKSTALSDRMTVIGFDFGNSVTDPRMIGIGALPLPIAGMKSLVECPVLG